jgi:rhamnulose-1-phosphate aldolase
VTDLLALPQFGEFCRAASDLYRRGWAERNGGNLSMLLEDGFGGLEPLRSFPLAFGAGALEGRCLLITGSGKYLKNVERDPEDALALLRLGKNEAGLLWGLKSGGRPSSELSAHLQSHAARLEADPNHRVVLHAHATHLVALTSVHELDDRALTKTVWSMCSEWLLCFPAGVGVRPWMPCGTDEIGAATAEKMRSCRLVVWANHGPFSAGSGPDDALGLLEVADKAAELYIMTSGFPSPSRIGEEQLRRLAGVMGLSPREGWL